MAGKPKLEVLDALRGFCALIVVIVNAGRIPTVLGWIFKGAFSAEAALPRKTPTTRDQS